jgi:hypothetical protein
MKREETMRNGSNAADVVRDVVRGRCDYLMPRNGGSPNFKESAECILAQGHGGAHQSIIKGRCYHWYMEDCPGCEEVACIEDPSCFVYSEDEAP